MIFRDDERLEAYDTWVEDPDCNDGYTHEGVHYHGAFFDIALPRTLGRYLEIRYYWEDGVAFVIEGERGPWSIRNFKRRGSAISGVNPWTEQAFVALETETIRL